MWCVCGIGGDGDDCFVLLVMELGYCLLKQVECFVDVDCEGLLLVFCVQLVGSVYVQDFGGVYQYI